MIRQRACLVLFALAIGALVYVAGLRGGRPLRAAAPAQAAESAEKKVAKPAPPPLVVNKDAPLLLEEPKPKEGPEETPLGPVADNTACYCCHTNYQEEEFAIVHAKADVGCMKCHGECVAHRNDEDNITPPDVMFGPHNLEQNCRECHETHDAPAAKVIAQWQKCCPARTDPNDLSCMDCHGEHRLKFRTVWWDKKTGKLGARAPGQRIKLAPDLTKRPLETTGSQHTPASGGEPGEEMR